MVEAAIQADEGELEGSASDFLENRKKVRAYLKQEMLKSRPEPQLRKRNFLDQFEEDDTENSDCEEGKENMLCTKDIDENVKTYGIDSDKSGNLFSDRKKSTQCIKNIANHQIGDDSESWPSQGFEKVSSHIQNNRDEAGHTDEDSTYASMDEDGGNSLHSPLKPLESLAEGSFRSQSTSQPGGSLEIAGSVAARMNETGGEIDVIGQPFLGGSSPFASESDSSDVELLNGFIVDDVGQNQARKKRRVEGLPRKRTVQQKLSIGRQSSASYHPRRRISENGAKSGLRLSKSKNKIQSRLKSCCVVSNVTQKSNIGESVLPMQPNEEQRGSRSFVVNNGTCEEGRIGTNRSKISQRLNQAVNVDLGNVRGSQITTASFGRGSVRVRIHVEGELLLMIPCIDDGERKTIKWLADQVN